MMHHKALSAMKEAITTTPTHESDVGRRRLVGRRASNGPLSVVPLFCVECAQSSLFPPANRGKTGTIGAR